MKKNEYKRRRVVGTAVTPDLSQGIQVEPTDLKVSLCNDCIHSGTDIEHQCSWDRRLILPQGTKYYIKPSATTYVAHMSLPIIVECQMYEEGHIRWCK